MKSAASKNHLIRLFLAIALGLSSAVYAQTGTAYKVIKTVAHNPDYFTQGLELHDGLMFESSANHERR